MWFLLFNMALQGTKTFTTGGGAIYHCEWVSVHTIGAGNQLQSTIANKFGTNSKLPYITKWLIAFVLGFITIPLPAVLTDSCYFILWSTSDLVVLIDPITEPSYSSLIMIQVLCCWPVYIFPSLHNVIQTYIWSNYSYKLILTHNLVDSYMITTVIDLHYMNTATCTFQVSGHTLSK